MLSKAQNRECQRKSRARRRDLVDDLKSRLQTYEQRDAAASRELQAAARLVQDENRRLRELLRLCRVSEEEIERFLTFDETPRCLRDSEGRVVAEEGSMFSGQRGTAESMTVQSTIVQSVKSHRTRSSGRSGLETSCDVAAAILVGLQGKVDEQGTRVALGCTNTGPCSVTNHRLFQLMDDIHNT